MEQKTKLKAEEGRQEIVITREFDLPLPLLFKAYAEPDIVEQWMGTKVVKLENRRHGSWQFETTDPKGNKHGFSGVFHEFIPEQKITRTFEMENTPFGVQLEFFEFERLSEETSKLTMHIVFRSVTHRDQMLHIPFAKGLDMAHNRLQDIANQLK
jgi:uncharacterized protein YndB with AHSA1/START domain